MKTLRNLSIRHHEGAEDFTKFTEISTSPLSSGYNSNYKYYPSAIKHRYQENMCSQNSWNVCPDNCCFTRPFLYSILPWGFENVFFITGFTNVGEVNLFFSGRFMEYYNEAYGIAKMFEGSFQNHPDILLKEIFQAPRFERLTKNKTLEAFKKERLRLTCSPNTVNYYW